MPDKQLSTISYAAGASLAAIALVYVFAPNFAIDESSTSASRKKGVVGLRNAANDCFINATLQALAGLNDLRLYLIRETHRRNIEDPAVYALLVQPPDRRPLPEWKLLALQRGAVTQGLKDILDALNERPIYKKSTSAVDFISVMETAFRQRVSRQQQDAQEFLQIVAERLQDEHHARATREGLCQALSSTTATTATPTAANGATLTIPADEEEEGFPMEGRHESQLQCQTCGYRSKPRSETFVTLTLNVPHVSSTSLSACFDEIFKTEYIDDFKCENCRLIHAEEKLRRELDKARQDHARAAKIDEDLRKLRHAIETDPENPPLDVPLPEANDAPKRRIARSFRITSFPKILTIHLSRSIFSTQASTKNSAKVSFPEHLPLGGLTDRRKYRLLAVVTHKGSHHSGHYESFRRQNLAPAPYANFNTFQASGIYSKSASPISTPQLQATSRADTPMASTPDLLAQSQAQSLPRLPNPHLPLDATAHSSPPSLASHTPSDTSASPRRSRSLRHRFSPTSAPRDGPKEDRGRDRDPDASSIRSVAASTRSALSRISLSRDRHASTIGNGTTDAPAKSSPSSSSTTPMAVPPAVKPHRKRKAPERWWRISDETISEAKTSEVLGMQREVYLLFYERED
ncbi:hypothetical protein ACRALDRAFT_2059562 [Sodiomyces alcalophilus JCM 7366]|uniref:uncharacterized protein n=1 Tax=Sodiomyces alcalophilus JCM 7366 TaxID=591952 RepID=UPI0039B5B04D